MVLNKVREQPPKKKKQPYSSCVGREIHSMCVHQKYLYTKKKPSDLETLVMSLVALKDCLA